MTFKSKTFIFRALMSFCLLCCVFSCSTRKNTFINRTYHGMVTRYNIYFNGSESFKEGLDGIKDVTKDNYTAILPVYAYPAKADALALADKWDRTIEKCSKAITKHSMLIKGVERCKPIDDAYLLMGKAYFYRQDYYDALRIFSYIINTHKEGNVWADAFTWRAQTHIALKQIEDAEADLEEIRQVIAVQKNKKYKQHWEAVYADKYIAQKDYERAAVYLSSLLEYKNMERDFKTRIIFILGQIYQNVGQYSDAEKYYAKVLKRNPIYEMEFNASINLAVCESGKKSNAKDKLKKMLRDERNEEYKDQIFYALSRIDFRQEDTAAGVKNLEASVYWSINNPYQKTVSALELAEYYFEHDLFIESQKYYDTVSNIVPETFPNYEEIKERASILKELVSNLLIIKTEEELQQIAQMSDSELDTYIEKRIAEYVKAEEERVADEEEKAKMMESAKKSGAGNKKSTWVFYNLTQAKLGEQEFRKKWGPRTLEDLWVVSDKNSLFIAEETEEETEENFSENEKDTAATTPSMRTSDPLQREFYLQDVPYTPLMLEASNEKIVTALYYSGFIYYDDLEQEEKAIVQWETLIAKFPEHKLYAPTCFQLYRVHTALNEDEKADEYKNIILTKFPESDFAKIIQNPDYYKEIAEKKKETEYFYAGVYELYIKKQYEQVINEANKGLKNILDPDVRAKLSYLRGISLGKVYGNDSLRSAMQYVITIYPMTAIDTLASGILEALKREEYRASSVVSQTEENQAQKPSFEYNDQDFHFVIILINIKEIRAEKLKLDIHNFNKEFFRFSTFDISNFFLDNTTQMVTISKFENKAKAMEYYVSLKANQTQFKELNQAPGTIVYAISDKNYTTFYKNKQTRAEYDAFFKKYYID